MRSFLRMYLSGIKLAFLTRISDRADFFASLLVMLGIELLPTLVTVLVYGRGLAFPGWSLPEAVLIQGMFLAARGLTYPVLAGMAFTLSEKVREGTFELVLLKPRHPLAVCIATGFDAEDIGKLFGGLGLCAYALRHLPAPAAADILASGALMSIAVVFGFACLIFVSTLLLVWVGSFRVYEIFETVSSLGQYPPVILPAPIRKAALAPVPILGLAVLPASALLGRGAAGWAWAAASSLGLFFLSLWIWNRTVRRTSTAGG
jgi:ABC-2 type transport system permease protein